jgi:flagellar hook-associated protein 1
MSSSALSIAVSALRAQTYAVETTSNNIANASTPGYRKQRVELKAAYPREGALGTMGSGVEAAKISRATDRLADLRVRGSSAQSSFFTERSDLLTQVEDVLGEPDHGVSTQVANVFSSFAKLAVNPSDDATRNQVISALQGTADRVNQVRTGLDQLTADASQRLGGDIKDANSILNRLVEINKFARTPTGLPADLADERDKALDQLAQTIGATSTIQDDGQVRVTLNGLSLVDDDRAVPLTFNAGPPMSITHPSGPITLGGTTGGLQAAITTDIAGVKSQLDSFVTGFAAALNALHVTGVTPAGTPGGPLLTITGGAVSVNVTTPDQLAAADVAGQPLNGNIADAIAQLRQPQTDAFRSFATSVASQTASVGQSADTAKSLADAASQQRDSIVGVNIDEEMTDLMSQQRAYQAAARLVSTIDDMLKSLIQM